MRVVVVGGGKMGLPLACQMASRGADVTVCDVDVAIVAAINGGTAPFEEPGLAAKLAVAASARRLRATGDTTAAARSAEVIVIIVPVLLTPDRDADLTNLILASRAVAAGLKPDALICYETTLPPGACRSKLIPILEESGLRAGEDFDVCFSPERVKSLTVFEALERTPKIVGGVNERSAARAESFYKRFLGADVINVRTLEASEMVKLSGMLYRDVNIALANELAQWCEKHGLNVTEIIAAANSDDETAMLVPGIGVGGHCTPVYPHFLLAQAERSGPPLPLVQRGRRINEAQPARNVQRLARVLGPLDGRRVHILGLAFRPGVKEHTCSPAFALRDELARHGSTVTLEDPLYSDDELENLGFRTARGAQPADAVILNTGHSTFAEADFIRRRLKGARVALDGRGFWNSAHQQVLRQLGCSYLCVGRGDLPTREEEFAVKAELLEEALSRGADAREPDSVPAAPRVAGMAAQTSQPGKASARPFSALGPGVRPLDPGRSPFADEGSIAKERPARPRLVIVTPVCNEAGNLAHFEQEVRRVLLDTDDWEASVIFVEDGSRDQSWTMIEDICRRDSRFRGLRLSRNFGSHAALRAGLHHADGDIVAIVPCDLQDPPEAVVEFIEKWRAGAQIVWGRRRTRRDTRWRIWASKFFESLARRFAMPSGSLFTTGSFLLMDRKVLECYKQFQEGNRVTFALVAWTGFDQAVVEYDRAARQAGQSSWGLGRMIKAAYDTFFSFSRVPFGIITAVGAVLFQFSIFLAIYLIWCYSTGNPRPDWVGAMLILSLFFGIHFIFMSIQGEYLSRIYSESVRRPLYFISEATSPRKEPATDVVASGLPACRSEPADNFIHAARSR